MKNITYDYSATTHFITSHTLEHALADARRALDTLLRGTCPGNDYLGWITLPQDTPPSLLDRVGEVADDLRQRVDTTVVIGIGGSYLGARAVIDATGGAIPVGYVTHLPEQDSLYAEVFG